MLHVGIDQGVLALVAIANLAIGLYVFIRAPKNPVHVTFFLFVSGIAVWVMGFLFLSLYANLMADKVVHYGGVLLLIGFLLFAQVFPSKTVLPRQRLLVFLPIFVAAVAIIPANVLVEDIVKHADGRIEPIVGPFLGWYAIGFTLYVAWCFWTLIQTYKNASAHERLQMRYFFLGLILLFSGILIGDLFLPALFSVSEFNLLGPVASIFFVLLTGYAIVRHRLMNIRFIIQRGVMYSVLLALIVAFYISSLQGLRMLFGNTDTGFTFISAVVTTILGIFTAPHIERAFRKVTDRIFFKDIYIYADAMHALSEVLYVNVEIDDLVRESETALASWLRASCVRITLQDVPAQDKALQIPIQLDGELIGCITLGEKRSGDAYTAEDHQLLKTFAYQAATAFSRAQLYANTREHAADLEEKVRARTQELSDAYARERQMINDISHNLQTPLTVLQTKLEQLKSIVKDNRKISSVEQSLASFSGFVYELLTIARLEGGRKPEHARINLSVLVSDLAEEIGIIAAESNVSIHTAITPNLFVLGDERRLREAVMNVASNALKYLKDTDRSITFSVSKEGSIVTVSINDSGIGISPEDLPHVFERFYRGKKTPKEMTGTGLGLPITKLIIEQHGGTVSARSTPGEGTIVAIVLNAV